VPVSLRDKLKAVDKPKPQKEDKPAVPVTGCYHEEKTFPWSELPGIPRELSFSGRMLGLVLGQAVPENIDPYRILYLDTETTGLSGGVGTLAFLTGAGYFTKDGFTVHQWVMRDYPEERFMLTALKALCDGFQLVVTFNGKTFDIPLLQARMLMNRMETDALEKMIHADLLHPARRVWKLRLKSCRLSRLEEEVFHAPRENDLPGSEAPERFFQFLKTGNFSLLEDVIAHNRLDIVSLAKLFYRLLNVYEKPEQQSFFEDIFSVGRALEKQGETALARHCYHLCTEGSVKTQAQLSLGRSYLRLREVGEAMSAYQRMISCHEGGLIPYVELAKLYEHRLHDVKNALEITKAAILLASEPVLCPKTAMQEMQNELQYRYMRLIKKTQTLTLTKEARIR
jgi:uncharacterized protein YprB with RNaseH-like and TPR domain